MTRSAEDIVYEALRQSFPSHVDGFSRDTVAAHVAGWDSLAHTLLILEVESGAGIELPVEDTLRLRNVGELIDLLDSRISGGGAG